MQNEKNPEIFVINENQEKAFKLVRTEGVLQAEVKTKTRDKKVPPLIYVDAIEVIDQVAAAMNREERLLAYSHFFIGLVIFLEISGLKTPFWTDHSP